MTESYASIISQLKSILEQECRIQSEYLKTLARQDKALTPFDTDEIEKCNMTRSTLCDRMAELQEQRKGLVLELTGGEEMRLSQALDRCCSIRDKQTLFPVVRRLKELVHSARSDTREFSELTSFSLGLVDSIISIVSSSRHGIARSYSGRGILRESYHPGGNRLSAVLKQA